MKKSIVWAVCFTAVLGKAQNTTHNEFKYLEYDIQKIQSLYKDKKTTVKEVVEAYLKRINDVDKNGVKLNSIITVNPDAVRIADSLDHISSKFKDKPLFGIPVLLKDNIDTHDKMPNTAGSLALKNSFPLQDSYLVKKLREAGAVIIGKTNLSEWANFRGMKSTSGWSGLGGLTKNPYILDRNTCGSSAGSGAAISANLGIVAIGTETNGSIVCPSSINGIVGLKPTVGLISRQGIIPISSTQDTPGPMARTVKDVAISLGTMAGEDKNDVKTFGNTPFLHKDYTRFLNLKGLKGKRLGYVKGITNGASKKVDELFLQTLKVLESQGAVIVEIEKKDLLSQEVYEKSLELMVDEYKDGINDYLASLGKNAPVKNIDELISFNKNNKEELKYFGQEYLEMAAKSKGTHEEGYAKAVKTALEGSREKGIDLAMKQYNLDAIISPTTTEAWKTDLKNGDHYTFGSSDAAAIAGYPSITLTMGYIDGLPVGILFSAEKWSEGKLINMAYTFEQVSPQRKVPQFLKE